jgi:hypothetical protein
MSVTPFEYYDILGYKCVTSSHKKLENLMKNAYLEELLETYISYFLNIECYDWTLQREMWLQQFSGPAAVSSGHGRRMIFHCIFVQGSGTTDPTSMMCDTAQQNLYIFLIFQ